MIYYLIIDDKIKDLRKKNLTCCNAKTDRRWVSDNMTFSTFSCCRVEGIFIAAFYYIGVFPVYVDTYESDFVKYVFT